eukprot:IDg23849t1
MPALLPALPWNACHESQPQSANATTLNLRLPLCVLAENVCQCSKICSQLAAELKKQAVRRENKRKHDQIEVDYIKKMMETGGKRVKSRFSKLLYQMHPNRELPVGTPMQASHAGANRDTNAHDRKKKKKKRKSHHDRQKSKLAHGSGDNAP